MQGVAACYCMLNPKLSKMFLLLSVAFARPNIKVITPALTTDKSNQNAIFLMFTSLILSKENDKNLDF
jgi:hypothetical protein